ncbi:hypothetical protein EmuJ_001201400 [Echinococcus multilocularis]|uniref:Uncharacterized protein n=1 Tax=Echinococcus multilocularis TaxID=6211 RepID=A0A068XUX6_ECHMU|nr:hypothetical protein EmuJ_001201400 [Echinococcus multilocularis]
MNAKHHLLDRADSTFISSFLTLKLLEGEAELASTKLWKCEPMQTRFTHQEAAFQFLPLLDRLFQYLRPCFICL